MKKSSIPFDMSVQIDPANLREKAVHPVFMLKGIEWLKEKLREPEIAEDSSGHGQILIMLGAYERIMNELKSSENNLKKARELFRKEGRLELIINAELRLATTYFWQGNSELAEKLFIENISKIQMAHLEHKSTLMDYAYTHYGKMHFECKQFSLSLEKLSLALEYKILQGDNDSIANHQKMMEIVNHMIEKAKS